MSYFTKLLRATAVASTLFFASFQLANATLITQEFGELGTALTGSLTVEIEDSLIDQGFGIEYFGIDALVDFDFWGWSSFDFYAFEFGLDLDNISAGLETLYIDMNDLGLGSPWAYQMEIDTAFPEFNFIDIFTVETEDFVYFQEGEAVGFGELTVETPQVSEPGVLALLGFGLLYLAFRRQRR